MAFMGPVVAPSLALHSFPDIPCAALKALSTFEVPFLVVLQDPTALHPQAGH